MIRLHIFAVVLAGTLGATQCTRSEAESRHLRIRVAPTPPMAGEARIVVQLPEGVAGNFEVSVAARPLHEEQGLTRTAHPAGPGVYAVAAFPFTESGEWRIVAQATPSGGGTVLRDSTNVRVIGSRR